MAIVPERRPPGIRGRSQPVTINHGCPRLGFRRWYRQARALGWTRRQAFRGAFQFGRV